MPRWCAHGLMLRTRLPPRLPAGAATIIFGARTTRRRWQLARRMNQDVADGDADA